MPWHFLCFLGGTAAEGKGNDGMGVTLIEKRTVNGIGGERTSLFFLLCPLNDFPFVFILFYVAKKKKHFNSDHENRRRGFPIHL